MIQQLHFLFENDQRNSCAVTAYFFSLVVFFHFFSTIMLQYGSRSIKHGPIFSILQLMHVHGDLIN